MGPLIEICLDSAESVVNAEKGGADRCELCSDLFEGGLTPSVGTARLAKRLTSRIKIFAMVRPRGGDFCYSDTEFEVMKEDARALKEAGVDGLVFGILNPDGTVDMERNRELVEIARPLGVTFHRALDMTRDMRQSLEDIISLGFDRVLTSGQEPTVAEGIENLQALIAQAGDRIIVMPGCGIKERNFAWLHAKLGAKEYHMSLSSSVPTRMEFHPSHLYMGGSLRQDEFGLSVTDADRVGGIMRLAGR